MGIIHGDWGLGIGDWGLEIRKWNKSPKHKTQYPNPKPKKKKKKKIIEKMWEKYIKELQVDENIKI